MKKWTYIIGRLVTGRLEVVKQAGAVLEGVDYALVVEGIGVKDLELLGIPIRNPFQQLHFVCSSKPKQTNKQIRKK